MKTFSSLLSSVAGGSRSGRGRCVTQLTEGTADQMNFHNGLAVLVGNGLSIACNPDLSMEQINAELVHRLNATGHDTGYVPAQVMQAVASNINQRGGDPATDFEALLGPFDQYRNGLQMLTRLSDLAGPHNTIIGNALALSADFVDSLRRFGVGHALDIIAERSRARYPLSVPVNQFISAVVESAKGSPVTFGNLNYDSLVMAALCDLFGRELCDMTDGLAFEQSFEIVPGMPSVPGRSLRVVGNYPANRSVRLLHLHGSLTWLRQPGSMGPLGVYRFNLDPLRSVRYWASWRDGKTLWTPEVVLTNQSTKDSLVGNYPFSLAYQSFYSRLLDAPRWLIAGYSFRDGCVNDLLARAWAQRREVPQVLVVTRGDDPSAATILDALRFDPINAGDPLPSQWLTIHRGGLQSAPNSSAWGRWTSDRTLGSQAS